MTPRPRPSEVVWAARGEDPVGPVPGGPRPTVAQTAQRIRDGEQWAHAVRELLDGLLLGGPIDDEAPVRVDPVVGGAAIALAYDERRSTRDIDAVFVPKMHVYRAAARVAADRGLPVGWLNDEDDEDLRMLAAQLRLTSAVEVLDLVERMAEPRLLTPRVQFFVEAVLED